MCRRDACTKIGRRETGRRDAGGTRTRDDADRDGGRSREPINPDFYARRKRAAAGVWRVREISGRSALEGLHFVLRILSRGQWGGFGRGASDGVDGAGGIVD